MRNLRHFSAQSSSSLAAPKSIPACTCVLLLPSRCRCISVDSITCDKIREAQTLKELSSWIIKLLGLVSKNQRTAVINHIGIPNHLVTWPSSKAIPRVLRSRRCRPQEQQLVSNKGNKSVILVDEGHKRSSYGHLTFLREFFYSFVLDLSDLLLLRARLLFGCHFSSTGFCNGTIVPSSSVLASYSTACTNLLFMPNMEDFITFQFAQLSAVILFLRN